MILTTYKTDAHPREMRRPCRGGGACLRRRACIACGSVSNLDFGVAQPLEKERGLGSAAMWSSLIAPNSSWLGYGTLRPS